MVSIVSVLYHRRIVELRVVYKCCCVFSQAVPSSHVAATLQQCTVSLRTRRLLLLELKRTPRTMLNCDHFVAVFNVLERDQTRQMRPDIRQMRSRVAIVLQRAFTHRYFTMAGFVIAAVNVLIITIELAREYEKVRNSSNTYLGACRVRLIFAVTCCVLLVFAVTCHVLLIFAVRL